MNQQINNKRKKWYTTKRVQFELLTVMRNREVVAIDNDDFSHVRRGFFISSTTYLDKFLDYVEAFKKDISIYISCARYKRIPPFTLDITQRSKDMHNLWWNGESLDAMYEYDFLIDCDLNHDDFLTDFNQLIGFCKLLTKDGIIFTIFPSGKNYQILINGKSIPTKNIFSYDITKESKNKYIRELGEQIKKRFDFKFMDLNGCGIHNKIFKCPYSLVHTRACMPLTVGLLENTPYRFFDSTSVLQYFDFGFNGWRWTNRQYIDTAQAQENFKRFMYKYVIEV